MKTISAPLECGVGFFALSLISPSLPIPGRRWSPQGAGGWMSSCRGCEMWITQHRLEPSATGFQPESPASIPLGSGAREGWVLYFSGTGQDCAHTWGWQKNRELFFMEQLELERGGENVPTRSPSNRAASAGWEAAGMLARIAVSSTGSHCALPAGFAKPGSVSQPLTPFPPSSAPPGSSLG